ncbi:30S ribosomal protein S11 [Candidatus Saccharibacteria bacterium]|nr:30S ribosomal protein S11 [Candidatus Saccharibacteria bacterium]MCR5699813.1 30S ribosomal protein S11 [Candidatus Saccharibacteria bacterium]
MAEEEVKNTTNTEVEAPKATKRSKKAKRIVNAGAVHIQATFNNTIITVSDKNGGVLSASSAGANGFRGSKKGTAFAAGVAAEKALSIAKKNHALNSVDVYVKGIGLGRDAAVRAISAAGIRIDSITDVTPIAHGGVRPKGERKP